MTRTLAPMPRLPIQSEGTGLSFPGTTAQVTVPDAAGSRISGTGFAFSTWVTFNTQARQDSIAGKYSSANDNGWMIEKNSTGTTKFVLYTTSATNLSGTTVLQANVPYHIVITYNGTTMATYVNGVLDASTGKTGSLTDASGINTTIGVRNAGNYLSGTLDDSILFSTGLTGTQILALYQYGTLPAAPQLRFNYNEGSGTTINDVSGNGNTGTLSGATFTSNTPIKQRILVT